MPLISVHIVTSKKIYKSEIVTLLEHFLQYKESARLVRSSQIYNFLQKHIILYRLIELPLHT
jgi:hypothetical protein